MVEENELEQIKKEDTGGYFFLKALLELFGYKDVAELAKCSVEELNKYLIENPTNISYIIINNVFKNK